MVSLPPGPSTNPYASVAYLHELLRKAVEAGGSDVHLKVGQPPGVRLRGDLVYFRVGPLRPIDTEMAARHILRDSELVDSLHTLSEHDCSYEVEGVGRFRVNVYSQRDSLAVVMRIIPQTVPSLDFLGAPAVCKRLAERERGLILCVGASGNGKSTTLAAMIDHINHTLARHVITIEDPIELIHKDDRSSISQREIGADTRSFAHALRAALRQDPDVIHVGEIRDSETMEIALQAAETGHLVLSTLHTPDVYRTINRVLSLGGGDAQELRDRMGDALLGIIAQRLLPRSDGTGRVLAAEVLVATGSVRETIKRPLGNPSLKELMEGGAEMYGMSTFEHQVTHLAEHGVIDPGLARTSLGF